MSLLQPATNELEIDYQAAVFSKDTMSDADTQTGALSIYPNETKDIYHEITVSNRTGKNLHDIVVSVDMAQGIQGNIFASDFDQITGAEYNYDFENPEFVIPTLSKGKQMVIAFHSVAVTNNNTDLMTSIARITSEKESSVNGVGNTDLVYLSVTSDPNFIASVAAGG
ncbi:MAG: hypothetical protein U9Q15_03865 [Patescibacteria group bacterium]|nr:hypothetical protein [Patescibacteria group bacterium]